LLLLGLIEVQLIGQAGDAAGEFLGLDAEVPEAGNGVGMAVIGAAGPRAWTAKGLAASGARAAGVVIQLPVIGVAESLAVGLLLLVPQVEPGDLLPVGGLLLLPPQRGAGGWRSGEGKLAGPA
jgi:hypothetical protein